MNDETREHRSVSIDARVAEVCDRYKKALQMVPAARIEDFLPPAESTARDSILRELILLDIEHRRERGESPIRYDYEFRFRNASAVLSEVFASRAAETVIGTFADFESDAATLVRSAGEAGEHEKRLAKKLAEEFAEDPNIGRTLGTYRLVERLGRGGMGAVYRATHTLIQCDRAIKLMKPSVANDPDSVQRFLREAQAAVADLSHPNIVKTFDLSQDGDEIYLVMELLDGEDLASHVRKHGPVIPLRAAQIIEHAATGLAYAHGKGYIHRDIKPHNIMLTRDGAVKILDMGLVRLLGARTRMETVQGPIARWWNKLRVVEDFQLTDGSIVGTVPYMSPEQICDPANVGAQADVYSLGCTLYHLLTGRDAYVVRAGLQPETLREITAGSFPPPRTIRPEILDSLEAIVLRMMHVDRTERFPNASALMLALRKWQLMEQCQSHDESELETTGGFIKVLTGPLEGHQRNLVPRRRLSVGRLAECDLSIRDDPQISRTHFLIEIGSNGSAPICRLTNLSSNGTWVNGRRIDIEAVLLHGDEIRIGNGTTCFVNLRRITDSMKEEPTTGPDGGYPVPLSIQINRSPKLSELLIFDFESMPVSRETIAAKFEEQSAEYAILDFKKAGLAIPDEISDPKHLLNWHPSPAVAAASPIVAPRIDVENFDDLVDQLWGRDAVILIYSQREPDGLVEHLRKLTQYDAAKRVYTEGAAFFAYYWPQILDQLLDLSTPELVAQILEGIDAVLLEGGSPRSWKAFGRDNFLERIFRLASDAEA